MQNMIAACVTVITYITDICRKSHIIFGALDPRPLGWVAWLIRSPRNMPHPTWYRAKFCRSVSSGTYGDPARKWALASRL